MFRGNYIDLLREWSRDLMCSMLIVSKDAYGDIKWGEEIEVESIEAFAEERNKSQRKLLGRNGQWYWVMSQRLVQRTDNAGKVIETYHPCTRNPYRLI